MTKEKVSEFDFRQLDKLISIIERFFEVEHFTKEGNPFYFDNKPNSSRMKMLLEDVFLSKGNNLSFSDKTELLSIFNTDVLNYLGEYIHMDPSFTKDGSFLLFLEDFFNHLRQIKKKKEKEAVLAAVRSSLAHSLGDSWKATLSEKSGVEVRKVLGSQTKPIVLIKEKGGRLFFVDVKGDTIIADCGDVWEKGHVFGSNKIYVFDKKFQITFDLLKSELQEFTLIDGNTDIGNFFASLHQKYHIHNYDFLQRLLEYEQFGEADATILLQDEYVLKGLVNDMKLRNVSIPQKHLFLEDKRGTLKKIGLFDCVEKISKLENGYKGKPAVCLVVKEGGEEKTIVTNGEEIEDFEID